MADLGDQNDRLVEFFRWRDSDGWLRLRVVERPGLADTYAIVLELDEGYVGLENALAVREGYIGQLERAGLKVREASEDSGSGTTWVTARVIHPETEA